jgi:hypothetical protein
VHSRLISRDRDHLVLCGRARFSAAGRAVSGWARSRGPLGAPRGIVADEGAFAANEDERCLIREEKTKCPRCVGLFLCCLAAFPSGAGGRKVADEPILRDRAERWKRPTDAQFCGRFGPVSATVESEQFWVGFGLVEK